MLLHVAGYLDFLLVTAFHVLEEAVFGFLLVVLVGLGSQLGVALEAEPGVVVCELEALFEVL
jgi:hypothetical protein